MFQRLPGSGAGITGGYDKAMAEVRQRDPIRRAGGVANLGVFGGPEAVKTVKGFAQDEAEAVRVAAQFALALLGQAEALPKMIEYLTHEKHEYRKRAVVALTSVAGADIAADHESVESCAAAKKAYEAWWKKSGSGLVWDERKKVFTAGGAGKAKK